MTLDGIDVSHYQTTTPSLAGRSFVFARATYDVVPDGMYSTHAAHVRAAGLTLGAYHFGTARSTVAAQVDAFLAAADTELLALDLESDRSVITTMTNAQAQAFIAEVHRRGHRIGLYHSDSGFPSLGQDWNWVAKWGTAPPIRPWAFWQYRGSPLDLDHFNGDQAALDRIAGVTPGGGDMAILAKDELADVPAGAAFYDAPGGTRIGSFSKAATVWSLGAPLDDSVDHVDWSWRMVQVNTGAIDGTLANKYVYVARADLSNFRDKPAPADTTPFDQADIDLAVKTEHDRWLAWLVEHPAP